MKDNISKIFRIQYGLSMQELANLCGKSRSAIMNWEYNNGCPSSTKFLLQEILDQNLSSKQMIDKLKQIFDKPISTKSI
jgi:DNA-binding transcriptional regulator YiaG